MATSLNNILLVDLHFREQPFERDFRVAKSKTDVDWHKQMFAESNTKGDQFAAEFHSRWIRSVDRGDVPQSNPVLRPADLNPHR